MKATLTGTVESFVEAARQVGSQFTTHCDVYEDALHTGNIPQQLISSLVRAFVQLRCALDVLANEMSLRCGLQVLPTQCRYPIKANSELRSFSSVLEQVMPGLASKFPELVVVILRLQQLSETDGWLAKLTLLTDAPDAVRLVRASAKATLSIDPVAGTVLSVADASGQPIPMLAPILMDEAVYEGSGEGRAFYLALDPGDCEAISFLNRCTRGVEHVAEELRFALAEIGV